MNPEGSEAYWNDRYQSDNTPWDLGAPSPSLVYLIEQHVKKTDRILIPGAGLAHEAKYLFDQGYEQVWVCDWAPAAIDGVKKMIPDFPEEYLLVQDFFKLDLEVDFILEQTFFCAIPREWRPKYVQKTHDLLAKNGYLMGLFFGIEMPGDGPPHGGNKEEYEALFQTHYEILYLDWSPYSIKPRAGAELLFKMRKKA